MSALGATPRYVLYLAVLPFYRDACMKALLDSSDGQVSLFAGDRHIDATVKTGISRDLYTPVKNRVFGSRILVQVGSWLDAIRADTTVVDLNPRSSTAWMLLIVRRMQRRRTLVWGHLHPRKGAQSSTAILRRAMRKFSSGTILYGYDSVLPAIAELPNQSVWVAPNSLYREADLVHAPDARHSFDSITYVGRLEPSKKVDLLIRGFAASGLSLTHQLVVVGTGSCSENLVELAETLGLETRVKFRGAIADPRELRAIYLRSVCSVSPGYVGLSLTQSLGFGVPMIVSQDEPHAPEIELQKFGGVTYFDTDSVSALAQALQQAADQASQAGRAALCSSIAQTYSAETMSAGLLSALRNEKQELMEDGWPATAK